MGGGSAFGSLLSSPWSVVLSWCVCCWVGVLCGRGLGPVWGPWSAYIPGYRVRAEGGGVGPVVCFFLRPLLLEFASTCKEGASVRDKVTFEGWDHLSTFL